MDYVRYLRSKKTIDDRALNEKVFSDFVQRINQSSTNLSRELRFIEVGAGVGAMFIRLFKRTNGFQNLPTVQYILIDIKRDVLVAAYEDILSQCVNVSTKITSNRNDDVQSLKSIKPDDDNTSNIHLRSNGQQNDSYIKTLQVTNSITVNFVQADAIPFLIQNQLQYDVLVAAAVLDIWDLQYAIETLLGAINKNSPIQAFYFPINFDGVTDFFPNTSEGAAYDSKVENMFHSAMGKRTICGKEIMACHTGRRLLPLLQSCDVNIRSIGGSSWIVLPEKQKYPGDEGYFLNCILQILETEGKSFLCKSSEEDKQAFERYMKHRRNQIVKGELFYVAHNIDVFGCLTNS